MYCIIYIFCKTKSLIYIRRPFSKACKIPFLACECTTHGYAGIVVPYCVKGGIGCLLISLDGTIGGARWFLCPFIAIHVCIFIMPILNIYGRVVLVCYSKSGITPVI